MRNLFLFLTFLSTQFALMPCAFAETIHAESNLETTNISTATSNHRLTCNISGVTTGNFDLVQYYVYALSPSNANITSSSSDFVSSALDELFGVVTGNFYLAGVTTGNYAPVNDPTVNVAPQSPNLASSFEKDQASNKCGFLDEYIKEINSESFSQASWTTSEENTFRWVLKYQDESKTRVIVENFDNKNVYLIEFAH